MIGSICTTQTGGEGELYRRRLYCEGYLKTVVILVNNGVQNYL